MNIPSLTKKIAIAGIAFAGAAITSHAQLIYNGGAPNQQDGNEMTEWIQSEDFTLGTAATIGSVEFWDVESAGAYQGSISWQIYSDNGGVPGTVLDSGSATDSHVATGVDLSFGDEYVNNFSIGSVSLGAGTYFLGLHNGPYTTTYRADMYWETTSSDASDPAEEQIAPFGGDNWSDNGQTHAFELFAPAAAVPDGASTASLLSIALGGLAFVRNRRK